MDPSYPNQGYGQTPYQQQPYAAAPQSYPSYAAPPYGQPGPYVARGGGDGYAPHGQRGAVGGGGYGGGYGGAAARGGGGGGPPVDSWETLEEDGGGYGGGGAKSWRRGGAAARPSRGYSRGGGRDSRGRGRNGGAGEGSSPPDAGDVARLMPRQGDAKSALNKFCSRQGLKMNFTPVNQSGPSHNPHFQVEVSHKSTPAGSRSQACSSPPGPAVYPLPPLHLHPPPSPLFPGLFSAGH